jgi:hypothetical protein
MSINDVTTVKAEQTDKRLHQVETLNVVDSGTSILVANPPGSISMPKPSSAAWLNSSSGRT